MKQPILFSPHIKISLICILSFFLNLSCKDISSSSNQVTNGEDSSQTQINESSSYAVKTGILTFSKIHLQSGKYISECYKEVDGIFFIDEATVQDNQLSTLTSEYLDQECKNLVRIKKQYSLLSSLELIQQNSNNSSDSNQKSVLYVKLSLLLKENSFTVHNQERIDYFNQNNVYEISDWVQNQSKDISGKKSFPQDPSSVREPKLNTTIVRYLQFDPTSNRISISEDLSMLDSNNLMSLVSPKN